MKSLEIRSWPIIRLPFAWTAGDLPCRRHFSNRLLEPVLKNDSAVHDSAAPLGFRRVDVKSRKIERFRHHGSGESSEFWISQPPIAAKKAPDLCASADSDASAPPAAIH
jgi:hypothetical protein